MNSGSCSQMTTSCKCAINMERLAIESRITEDFLQITCTVYRKTRVIIVKHIFVETKDLN